MFEEEKRVLYGKVVAEGVRAEDYMAQHAQHRREWIEGTVIQLSPTSVPHNKLIFYLNALFDTYFDIRPVGDVVSEGIVMQLEAQNSRREPDLMVILKNNPGKFTETAMIGPADICVEVVSPESAGRDYSNKYEEYERGKVREYWIIDPQREVASFHRLGENGKYSLATVTDDHYESPLLPDLKLHIPTFWEKPLPGARAAVRAVETMLGES